LQARPQYRCRLLPRFGAICVPHVEQVMALPLRCLGMALSLTTTRFTAAPAVFNAFKPRRTLRHCLNPLLTPRPQSLTHSPRMSNQRVPWKISAYPKMWNITLNHRLEHSPLLSAHEDVEFAFAGLH
jgi:hypothetical protein